jgi:hypothetical protein
LEYLYTVTQTLAGFTRTDDYKPLVVLVVLAERWESTTLSTAGPWYMLLKLGMVRILLLLTAFGHTIGL